MNPAPTPTYSENRLRTLTASERPQERLVRHGASSLSDAELLAMLLRSGTQGHDVLTLATRLLSEAGSLNQLTRWSAADFRRLKGIGQIKALQLVTVLEIASRIVRQNIGEAPVLLTAEAVHTFMQSRAQGLTVEKFWVICLNNRNRVLRCAEVTSGTVNSTLVHPREVYNLAIRESASAILCVHNHPSGDPSPSAADLRVTRQLVEAGRLLQIPLQDHVIIGCSSADPLGLGHYSFLREGQISST